MSFLEKINAHLSGEQPAFSGGSCGRRSVGDSVHSYLTGRSVARDRVMDGVARGRCSEADIHEVACILSGVSRSVRREYLSSVVPSSRRLLLSESARIRRRVSDSGISYSPELCWAIAAVVDRNDLRGWDYLDSHVESLPSEVRSWYDAFRVDRHSAEAMDALERLGSYRLVQDDDRVREYLAGASAQEEQLEGVVSEAIRSTESLSEEAQEVLEDVNEQAVEMTGSFLEGLMGMYQANVAKVVSEEVSADALAATEEILQTPVEESTLDGGVNSDDEGSESIEVDEVVRDSTVSAYREVVHTGKRVGDATKTNRGLVNRGSAKDGIGARVDDADSSPEYIVHGTFDQDDADWEQRSEAQDWDHTDLYRVRQRIEYLGLQEDGSYGVRYYSPSGKFSDVMSLHKLDYDRNLARDKARFGEDGRTGLDSLGYVKDSADFPTAPVAVGVPVQVSYLGNLYNGRIASAGNGCIVVEGLPFEYFSARNEAGCFTGTDADMMFPIGETVFIVEDLPVLEGTSAGADVLVPAEGGGDDAVILAEAQDEGADASVTEVVEEGIAGELDSKVSDATQEELEERFVDVDRAVFASEYMDIPLDDLEQADDEGKGYRPHDGEALYFYERSELEDAGLMPGDTYDEEAGYFIFKESTMSPMSYREESNPLFTQDYLAAFAMEGRSGDEAKVLEGIDKLILQLGNLAPMVKRDGARGKGRPMYSWSDYVISLTYPTYSGGKRSESTEDFSALALVQNFKDGTDDVVAFFYPDDNFRGYYERIHAGEHSEGDLDAMFPEDKDDFNRIAQSLVNGAITRGLIKKEDQDALRMSLRNVITDSADFLYTVDRFIDEVLAGHDFVRSDDSESIMLDSDSDVAYVIFMDPESTDIIPAEDAKSFLKANLGRFESLFTDLGIEVLDVVSDDAESALSGVTTMADVDGGVPGTVVVDEVVHEDLVSSDVWPEVSRVVSQWGKDHCFELGQNPSSELLVDAAVSLGSSLGELLKDVRVDATVPRILCKDQRFIDIKSDGVSVGSVLFVYQTSDSGIDAFANGVAEAAVQLAHKIYDVAEVSTEVEVQDDSDALLSEQAKQDVLNAVEREIEEALEAKGLAISDSVSIDMDAVRDSAPNTFDIPHTSSTFHRIRDTRKVMDSVLAVASESLGERISPALYRSLQKSSSKRARQKVAKVVDTALLMGELDLLCPALYKERLTDSHWMCDDVFKVVDSFGLDKSSFRPGACSVVVGSVSDERAVVVRVGSRDLSILQ